jgi:uncharacterized protein YjbI with pentapeptide repeats
MKSKDELVQLLRNGLIDEYNEVRSTESQDMSEIDLSGCDIHGANLADSDLTGSDFSECDLTNVDFTNSDISAVVFTRATLKETNFTGTTLAGTKFGNSDIIKCDFTEADMVGADFIEADLSNTDLSLALNLSQCIFDSFTIWPDTDSLPDDFDPEYIEDLSSLKDEDDELESEYGY